MRGVLCVLCVRGVQRFCEVLLLELVQGFCEVFLLELVRFAILDTAPFLALVGSVALVVSCSMVYVVLGDYAVVVEFIAMVVFQKYALHRGIRAAAAHAAREGLVATSGWYGRLEQRQGRHVHLCGKAQGEGLAGFVCACGVPRDAQAYL